MDKKGARWLYQELPELVKNNILSQESSDKLREYYGEIKTTGRTWLALTIFGILGAILIGLGIILLIGHNWEQLSRFTRSVISIAPLIIAQVFAAWVLWNRPNSSALKEGSAIFLSLMIGASIALISQTYNIPPDASTFTLTWMLLILPIVYLMQASIPAAIYLTGITAWSESYYHSPSMTILFWPLAALIVPHFIWTLRDKIYTLRATILSLVMAICILLAAGSSLGRTWPGAWMIIFLSIYSIFYSLGVLKFTNITTNWQKPFYLIGALGSIVLAFLFSFDGIWEITHLSRNAYKGGFYNLTALPDLIITFSIIVLAILLFYDNVKRKNLTDSLTSSLPILAIAGYFLKDQSTILPALIFNVYLLAFGITHIMIGLRENKLSYLNTGMLILAVLIIMRFFDSNINFMIKGLVFIAMGIGFLAGNAVLIRKKGGAR